MVHKHKNWGIDWKEYDARRVPGRSYYDNMWAIFNKQLSKGPQDFGRMQYLYMFQLLNEEGKRDQALQMLLHVLYLDFSGVDILRYINLYRQGIYQQKDMRDMFNEVTMFAPEIINPIKKFADVYTDEMVAKVYEQRLPVQICDQKLFLSIVHAVLDGTYDQDVAEDKLKRAYYKYLRENLFVQ